MNSGWLNQWRFVLCWACVLAISIRAAEPIQSSNLHNAFIVTPTIFSGSAPDNDAGFAEIEVQTVVQDIEFPSVLDYVRFQLVATPMSFLLSDYTEPDRQTAIETIALETARRSDLPMLEGGKFSFPQEAYVGTARANR